MCNTQLPDNAIETVKLKPGMKIYSEFDPTVYEVDRIVTSPNRVKVFTVEGKILWASPAGSFRLENAPGYNYHSGHGCKVVV